MYTPDSPKEYSQDWGGIPKAKAIAFLQQIMKEAVKLELPVGEETLEGAIGYIERARGESPSTMTQGLYSIICMVNATARRNAPLSVGRVLNILNLTEHSMNMAADFFEDTIQNPSKAQKHEIEALRKTGDYCSQADVDNLKSIVLTVARNMGINLDQKDRGDSLSP